MIRYSIKHHNAMVCDSPQRINFHVTSGDYFAYLATKIGFLEDSLVSDSTVLNKEQSVLLTKELRADLRYLQAHYAIKARELGDIQSIPAKGNILSKSL